MSRVLVNSSVGGMGGAVEEDALVGVGGGRGPGA